MGGIIESNLITDIPLLKSPGVLWNLDVVLIALVYFAIGFYNKKFIWKYFFSNDYKYDVFALIITILLIGFCIWNYGGINMKYYFDMKYVYYHELISAILIPCLFGFVICRIVRLMGSRRWIGIIYNWLSKLGRMTIPIMFLHIAVNSFRESIGYGWIVYVLLGLGIPIIFTITFCRFPLMRKLFMLPDFSLK